MGKLAPCENNTLYGTAHKWIINMPLKTEHESNSYKCTWLRSKCLKKKIRKVLNNISKLFSVSSILIVLSNSCVNTMKDNTYVRGQLHVHVCCFELHVAQR